MIVRFRSVKIAGTSEQELHPTAGGQRRSLVTTQYDLASVQDHILDVPLLRPPSILKILGPLLAFLIGGMLMVWIPLILFSFILGKSLFSRLFELIIVLWGLMVFFFIALPAGKSAFLKKQMESCVKDVRGTQARYEVVLLKDWQKWVSKLKRTRF